MNAELSAAVADAIAAATGARPRIEHATPAGGGCIHDCWTVAAGQARYFVKVNDARFAASFTAEADGLAALAAAGARVPQPIAQGATTAQAFLVLEYLALGEGTSASYRELGRMLARLHAHHGPRFGWRRDNYIGLTPQSNAMCESWAEFWQRERIAPQLALAARNGYRGRVQSLGDKLLAAIPQLLGGYEPKPSLLHGDLWRGNAGFLADGAPVIFDPAVYYGDSEADLAMTVLFGGFPRDFYAGYRELCPSRSGETLRRDLYNLYHVLNHLNLFGGSYGQQAEAMMSRLL